MSLQGLLFIHMLKGLPLFTKNLGNWSSFYYPIRGYSYLAPILGLLAYSAANLSAISLPELEIMASSLPITINFSNARPVPSGLTAKCVWFSLNGSVELFDPFASNVCSTYRQGHFSIVVNSTMVPPAPAPSPAAAQVPAGFPMTNPVEEHKSKAWKIAVSVVVGFVGILLLSLLITWLVSNRKKKEFIEMQKREDAGEILRMGRVRNTRLPMAPMTRTQPVIESGYVA
ncbi:hypothetical protein HPP92_018082 [Vanilla planifolia]|uniref:Uncharacterized protein n=1 Tax=Vanilla planifolia TaxID=51239 RepID=A0A835QC48_VANPL|nr:hypothetical protein HPP92_018082 [Vanilla planifolia]